MSMSLTRLLHRVGQLQRGKAAREFDVAARRPERAQQDRLAAVLSHVRDSAFGKAHDLAKVKTVDEWRRAVPLMTPDDLFPWVERLLRGEQRVLTDEAPEYFVRTTGTTGAPKHVPITDAYRREFQKTVHVALWHLYRRFPRAFTGKALYFVGSPRLDVTAAGTPIGTMSGYNFQKMGKVVNQLYAWPIELFGVADLATRNTLALQLALLARPTMMVGIFPASIVYLLRDLEEQLEPLAHHIGKGTLGDGLVLTDEQRAFFRARVDAHGPDAELAARLEQARGLPRGKRVPLLFPELSLVYCWTSSTAGAFVPELQEHVGLGVPIRDAIYSACEGWCSIPMGEPDSGGALAVTSHHFEFIDEESYALGKRDTVLAHELVAGRRYLIVFSTSAGVCRYLLGDLVEVSGRYLDTPKIRFVQKIGAQSNVVGEKLLEVHASLAVDEGLRALDPPLRPTFFTLAPDLSGPVPRYRLFVEADGIGADTARTLARAVDDALARNAADYARLKRGKALGDMAVSVVETGAYRAWRQERMDAGTAEPQIKVAHIVADVDKVPALVRARSRDVSW